MPGVSQSLPPFTMVDNPFSILLPPSPFSVAFVNINHTNKVLTPEKTIENEQEMIDFMHGEDYTYDNNDSLPSNMHSDLVLSLIMRIPYPLFKNNIKEVLHIKNKSRNRQKLNDSLLVTISQIKMAILCFSIRILTPALVLFR